MTSRILVFEEISAGSLTPNQCYHNLSSGSNYSYMFDVSENNQSMTYLGFNAISTFTAINDSLKITNQGRERTLKASPLHELRKFIKDNKPTPNPHLLKFADALFGFVSYDAARISYELPNHHSDKGDGKPDIFFAVFEIGIIFNPSKNTVTIIISSNPEEDQKVISEKIRQIIKKMSVDLPPKSAPKNHSEISIHTDLDDKKYKQVLIDAKEYIKRGEVFQVVISRTFSAEVKTTPFQIHCALNNINPSPYMFLFETPDYAIIGASPEKLVSVKNRIVEVAVLGGSHPKQPGISDKELGENLLKDKKEVAEHNMKMETARNDAMTLAAHGTLEIQELRGYRVFSHILHIITRFKGKLKEEFDCIDAIKTVLPSATITGSPKSQAMNIIDKCETSRRGIYGGAICLMDFEDNLISCLTIRTIILDHGTAYIRAGAGLVSNSDPNYEVNESIHKANAALETLKKAGDYPP